jgi:putative phosphoesterase
MKILLFSDSHGFANNIIKAVNENRDTDLIIHLGDFVRDIASISSSIEGIGIEMVSGNNDWNFEFPTEKIIEIEGKKLFLTHGHKYNVKRNYQTLINKGKELKVDAIFFGHTHIAEEIYCDNMMVLNPGSVGAPMVGYKKTFSVIELMENKLCNRFECV